MTYSGTWKSRARYFVTPQAHHLADPAHMEQGQQDDPGLYATTAPPADLPRTDEYFGYEGFQGNPLDTPGETIYQDPVDHDIGIEVPVQRTTVADLDFPGEADADMIRLSAPQHSIDYGGPALRNRGFRGMFKYDEIYSRPIWDGYGSSASDVTEEALRRGINAEPQNNPPLEMYDGEGWRRGNYQFDDGARNRKMGVRIIQSHDARWFMENLAYAPTDQPAPHPANPTTSPFSSLGRAIKRVQQQPMLRRMPESPSETVMTDGTEEENTVSVIGGGF